MSGGGLLLLALVLSYALTGAVRRYALARSLLDIPNARSSHAVPMPRGGGLAIVVTFLLLLPAATAFGAVPATVCWGLSGAGALVALVGFVDDHGHIAARWRLLVHFAAAAWGLFWLGGMPPIALFGQVLVPGWLSLGLGLLGLVWLLNLYNFMDGIDGIAGVEAVTVCAGALVIERVAAPGGDGGLVAALLGISVLGFLFWNFPRARIFMGDAGSGFIGLLLGLNAIRSGWAGAELLWCWLILLGVFIVDATVTLIRRGVRGETIYEAHRSHAYQFAARHYGAHQPVTLGVGLLNLLWLFPLSLLVALGWLDGAVGLLIAYAPLLWLAWRFKAGVRED